MIDISKTNKYVRSSFCAFLQYQDDISKATLHVCHNVPSPLRGYLPSFPDGKLQELYYVSMVFQDTKTRRFAFLTVESTNTSMGLFASVKYYFIRPDGSKIEIADGNVNSGVDFYGVWSNTQIVINNENPLVFIGMDTNVPDNQKENGSNQVLAWFGRDMFSTVISDCDVKKIFRHEDLTMISFYILANRKFIEIKDPLIPWWAWMIIDIASIVLSEGLAAFGSFFGRLGASMLVRLGANGRRIVMGFRPYMTPFVKYMRRYYVAQVRANRMSAQLFTQIATDYTRLGRRLYAISRWLMPGSFLPSPLFEIYLFASPLRWFLSAYLLSFNYISYFDEKPFVIQYFALPSLLSLTPSKNKQSLQIQKFVAYPNFPFTKKFGYLQYQKFIYSSQEQGVGLETGQTYKYLKSIPTTYTHNVKN